MLSPFYIFLIILAIISPINAYNRQVILKNINIENEIIIISTGILIIFILSQLIRKKTILPEKINNKTIIYLIINTILASIALYLGGFIITKYNVLRYKSIQKPVYLVILVIIACAFYEKKCNLATIFGIILLICGCVIIDRNLK